MLLELALVTDIIKYILWTRCCAENQAVPEQLLALKFTKYRRRIWVGKFITQHPSCVYRNCKVFPLPGSLFRRTTCLCVTNDSEKAVRRRLSVRMSLFHWGCWINLLPASDPAYWAAPTTTSHFVLNALAHFWSQEPSSLGLIWV